MLFIDMLAFALFWAASLIAEVLSYIGKTYTGSAIGALIHFFDPLMAATSRIADPFAAALASVPWLFELLAASMALLACVYCAIELWRLHPLA